MKWRVEYNNEPGAMDEYFREWWAVTDGVRSFNSSAENEAKWLCDKLNDESPEPQQGNESKNGYTITLFYVDGKPSTFTDSRCNNKK